MKREHAAIIARARRDGLKPVELATELMGYTLIEAMRDASASQSVAFSKMSEVQQDACIQQWTAATKEAIDLAIQVIASAGTRTVRMDLTSVAVGKKLKVAGVVAGTEEYKHDLIDLANDQGTAIVILNERDYLQGLDGIKGEPDQKALGIEEAEATPPKSGKAKTERAGSATSAAKLAAKAIELTPKQIESAREFVTKQQNCSPDALQNLLKINRPRAEAILKHLEGEGVVQFVGTDASGEYQLVRATPVVHTEKIGGPDVTDLDFSPADNLTFDGEQGNDAAGNIDSFLSDDLYAKIKAHVLKTGKFSVGSVLVSLDIGDDSIVEEAAQRLEAEGVLTEENEAGIRSIVA